MVDSLEALGGEVVNEVLTAQTGQKTVWEEKQGCLDLHYIKATQPKVELKYKNFNFITADEKCRKKNP